MKILVAEDSLTQATLMKLALQRRGHEVSLARDGIEAVLKTYRERPDLVVSDVVMPRVNGYQLCRLLRDDPLTAHTPVILLTSLDQRQDAFWGLKSGADKFLIKGGDIPALVEQILEFVASRPAPLPGAPAPAAAAGQGAPEGELMERVIRLLDRSLFESTVVSEIQSLVNNLDDLKKTAHGVLEILRSVIEFDVATIVLGGDDHQGTFSLVCRPVDRAFLGAVLARVPEEMLGPGVPASPVAEHDITDPEELLYRPGPQPAEPRSLLLAPLGPQGVPSGVIAVASGAADAFPDRVRETFGLVARQANIVLDYARLYERNKLYSITDGLTKLYNHRYFQDALKREFARSLRHKSPLSLIMLDIDRFKGFNDTYGHQQGDHVLQELARILKGQVRALDIVARYGGEEFALLMPEARAEVARRVAERLRVAVEQHRVPGPEGPLRVTISLGVATIPDPEIFNTAGLITAADRALYRAKEQGRNRVCA